MAKSKMNLKYKSKKRERKSKVNPTVVKTSETKSTIITIALVVGFIGVFYLACLGLENLGTFDKGYTKPEVSTAIGYTNILIGETFNRPETEYFVLFDKGDTNRDMYVQYLTNKYEGVNTYFVDMTISPNSKYLSEDENTTATNVSDIKIKDITLIRIKNGRIVNYVSSSDAIENYLSK